MNFMPLEETNILIHGICIIEWGELVEPILPNNYIKISFSKDINNINTRLLNIEPHGDKLTHIIERMF